MEPHANFHWFYARPVGRLHRRPRGDRRWPQGYGARKGRYGPKQRRRNGSKQCEVLAGHPDGPRCQRLHDHGLPRWHPDTSHQGQRHRGPARHQLHELHERLRAGQVHRFGGSAFIPGPEEERATGPLGRQPAGQHDGSHVPQVARHGSRQEHPNSEAAPSSGRRSSWRWSLGPRRRRRGRRRSKSRFARCCASEPSSSARVVDRLPTGKKVPMLGQTDDGNWVHIRSGATRGLDPGGGGQGAARQGRGCQRGTGGRGRRAGAPAGQEARRAARGVGVEVALSRGRGHQAHHQRQQGRALRSAVVDGRGARHSASRRAGAAGQEVGRQEMDQRRHRWRRDRVDRRPGRQAGQDRDLDPGAQRRRRGGRG